MRAISIPGSSYAFVLSFLIILQSCHSSGDGPGGSASAGIKAADAVKYTGTYSGAFNKGFITLVINYISGQRVSGYNVHKGLRRNVNGEVTRNGSLLNFVLKEPGDNPYDGIFYFTMDTADLAIRGRWVAKDSAKISTKTFDLSRRPDAGEMRDDDMWTTGGGDTTLTFNKNGTCEYAYYERPQDSTSQLITIRGNYERKVDTFRMEWEKTTHTPAQSMKLVIAHVKIRGSDDQDYDESHLRGYGLDFRIFIGE